MITNSINYFGNYVFFLFCISIGQRSFDLEKGGVISPLLRLKDSKLCPVYTYALMTGLECHRPNDVFFTLEDGSCIS